MRRLCVVLTLALALVFGAVAADLVDDDTLYDQVRIEDRE